MTAILVESALRSLLCAAVVGLGLTVFRVRNVPARKLAWTLVLVAAILMPWLMRAPLPSALRLNADWVAPVRGMVASAEQMFRPAVLVTHALAESSATKADAQPAALAPAAAPAASDRFAVVPAVDVAVVADPVTSAPARHTFQWPPVREMILWTYLAIAGALLLRLLIGFVTALYLWVTAEPVSPLIAPEPNVRASAKIPAPVTIGSGIILPADYAQWHRSKLRMVMAHERSHVRQMDFYLQLLAGVYSAVFWFSPLGWWLRHVLCSLGEAIGDRAGMEAAATRSHYAETLLEIASLPHRALPGVAMARSANLSRRVESMLNERQLRRAFVEGKIRAAASLLVVPVALLLALAILRVPAAAAQSAQQPTPPPQTDSQSQQQAKPTTGQSNPPEDQVTTTKPSPDEQQNPAALPTPAAPTQPAAPAAPGTTQVPAGQSATPPAPPAAEAPEAPEAPAMPDMATPPEPPEQSAMRAGHHGYMYHYGWDGDSYALVTGDNQHITMTSDGDEMAELDKARHAANGPFLWFRHDGKSYIVTDPAIIASLQKMYAPMDELGKQQAALGRQQEALGRKQEELGRQQREAGVIRMPDLSREMADLSAALAKMRDDQTHWNTQKWADLEAKLKADQDKMLTPERMAELQERMAEFQQQWNSERMAEFEGRMAALQAKLGSLQGEAGARMGEFGSRMGELGQQQGELGRKQGELGRQQGNLAREMNREVQKVIHDSLANGKAKPVQ